MYDFKVMMVILAAFPTLLELVYHMHVCICTHNVPKYEAEGTI